MIPSDHFIYFYNEVFKYLVKKGPKELDRYYQRVADRQANFTVEIVPGEFIMFFPPYGGHRPNCTRENPQPKDYLKAVVKVKMS